MPSIHKDAATKTEADDYDTPWKEALEQYFEAFIALLFPQVHAGIAWEQGYEFLDKELKQVTRDAELGKRRADKLVKVQRNDGTETWVLVHVEVQSQHEHDFARRMYIYNYRLLDRYDRQVASLAVLGDERDHWRPHQFGYALWGCKIDFDFPIIKLLDYRERWEELAMSDNPFALIIMAHLKVQETRQDPEARKQWKFKIVRRLYEQGYARQDVVNLFHFIDWLLVLPDALATSFWQDLQEYEEEARMPYVTSVERIGFKRGLERGLEQGLERGLEQGLERGLVQGEEKGLTRGIRQGLLDGIELGLELKFGAPGLRLLPEIRKIEDVHILHALLEGLKTVDTLDELGHIYRNDNA
jgi:hypothetical protein